MSDWYHSGIEAFCKTLVTKLRLPSNQSGWGNIVAELFGEESLRCQKKDKMSKLWRLSSRVRIEEFESEWSRSDSSVLGCVPLEACVAHIMEQDSFIRAYFSNGFSSFHVAVAEAMAQGFVTEGYPESSARHFLSGVRFKAESFSRSEEYVRGMIRTLVAAAIYGPENPAAMNESDKDTIASSAAVHQSSRGIDAFFGDNVVFTQLHGEDLVYIGDRVEASYETVLFFGLNGSLEEYKQRLASKLEEIGLEFPQDMKHRVFSISRDCVRVSRFHAAAFCLDDNEWYCLDLGSKNGTMVVDAAGTRNADLPISFRPGARIVLGSDAEDPRNAVIVASAPYGGA